MAIYVKIVGNKQGAITGPVVVPRYAGQIKLESLSFGFARPFDTHTGLAAGRQVGRPMIITKEMDQTSPLLMTASFTNEVLKTCTISYSHDGAGSVTKDLAKIVLTDAIIQVFEQKATGSQSVIDELTLTYRSMEFTWINGGLVAMNDWSQSS
jgi:type VI secretion system secreted protein Hcp